MILCRLLYPCSHHTRQKVEICQSHSRNPSTCPVTTTADVAMMWLVYSSLLCISLYFHPKTTFWTLQFSLAHLKHIVISFISSFFLFCTVNLLKNLSNQRLKNGDILIQCLLYLLFGRPVIKFMQNGQNKCLSFLLYLAVFKIMNYFPITLYLN